MALSILWLFCIKISVEDCKSGWFSKKNEKWWYHNSNNAIKKINLCKINTIETEESVIIN